ncbi:MAG: hypothetical protein KGQ89_05495, partial [Verrucomicrobia bacterium]|nr:hypothetical protein [Verrucomicrobiota bacterium]
MDSHAEPGIFPPVNREMSFALGSLLLIGLFPVVAAEPIVAGVATSKLDPELKGQVLIEELNCAACHSADP